MFSMLLCNHWLYNIYRWILHFCYQVENSRGTVVYNPVWAANDFKSDISSADNSWICWNIRIVETQPHEINVQLLVTFTVLLNSVVCTCVLAQYRLVFSLVICYSYMPVPVDSGLHSTSEAVAWVWLQLPAGSQLYSQALVRVTGAAW